MTGEETVRSRGFDGNRVVADATLARAAVADLDGEPARELTSWLRERVGEHVDGGDGFVVVSGLDGFDRDEAERLVVLLSSAVGDLVAQDAVGTLVREVKDRGVRLGEGATGRYSDSRDGGSLHTDGAPAPMPMPDYFTLFCLQQAPRGGELLLVDFEEISPLLGAEHLAVLREPFYFDRREAAVAVPCVVKPILFPDAGRVAVTYLRDYIDIAHQRPDVPDLTPAQRAALDALDTLLDDPAFHTVGRMAPGELGIFDNKRLLHGRTAFEDDPDSRRLLLRTWIARRAA